ncbi:Indoleamine 2,3-dioxygenase [Zopfochytrium polystomum]|nr:Indoleamine 2,3-dioxygenase [Zopfochytrium polystomum]
MPVSGAANSSAGSSSSAPPSNASTSADSNASGAPHRQLPLPLPTPALKKKTIPTLAEYGVSATSAFMPTDPPPLLRLPAYFEPWELVLDDLTSLLLANRLRRRVLALPTLDTARLSTLREWQRAYLVLSFIGQGYVWGKNENAEEVLPANVAVPWCAVCFHLDLKPIISYASVELYNYKLLDPLDPPTLDNLAILHTFSGGTDEAWFYLISLAMEAAGAPAVPAIIDALNAVETGDLPRLRAALEIIEVAIEQLNEILPRMYEKNDGHIFFHRVRPYMNGWEKSDDLPNGVLYEGVTAVNGVPNGLPSTGELPQGTYGKYAGASAGQSPLIHVIDLAMGITHFPAKTMGGPPPTPSGTPITHQPQSPSGQDASFNFIHAMREYMPGPFRRFVYAIADSYSIRSFKAWLGEVDSTVDAFNRCVEGMRAFRDKHIQMVALYIVVQARKKMEVGYVGTPAGVKTERVNQALLARGTGGTNLMPFLKQTRDETTAARVGPSV